MAKDSKPKILWRVGDGKVHEIPSGATIAMVGPYSAVSLRYNVGEIVVRIGDFADGIVDVVARDVKVCPNCCSALHEVPPEPEIKFCVRCLKSFRIV